MTVLRAFFLLRITILAPLTAVAQQKPVFSMIPFTNDTHKTPMCNMSRHILEQGIDLKYGLEGFQLSVGVVNHPNPAFLNLREEDETIDPDEPGLFAVILDELALRARFTWRDSFGLILPPHHEINTGRTVDGHPITWTDVLVDAVERYDFTFAEWVHNTNRRQLGVGFPTGWYDASTILIQKSKYKRPEFLVTSFLRPFSIEVWIMIIGLVFFSAVVYWRMDIIIERRSRRFTAVDVFLPAMEFAQHQVGMHYPFRE